MSMRDYQNIDKVIIKEQLVVRKDVGENEHERLPNIILRLILK